jgi:rhamnogalacturonan endolyase
VGIGGNENTTTRFRKYHAFAGKPILKEYLDKEHLLKGNKQYSIRIEVLDGHTSLWVDNVLYLDFVDNQPLTNGYFGFRTTRSHQRFEHFRVYRLAP